MRETVIKSETQRTQVARKTMELLPQGFSIKEESESHGIFEIAGLYPGYGTTLGNALRRILLSSIEGSAFTSVKIKEAKSEFDSIDGVQEGTFDIILNLKQVNLKLIGDQAELDMELKAKGKGIVTAGDIKTGPLAEIINKDLPIATLTNDKAHLIMELHCQRGLGYVNADQFKGKKADIGVVFLDAIFSPVRSVNFSVENMRVGKRTDYNKLVIEIATNGAIAPKDALLGATKILREEFEYIENSLTPEAPKKEKSTKEKKATKSKAKEK